MAAASALDELRARTQVDCDTMAVDVAKSLGPFVDCTSNQAIAYNELLKPKHAALIKESILLANELKSRYPDVAVVELAVEISMVKLQLQILPFLSGAVHVQTNPIYSYSETKTVAAAQRIVSLFEHLNPAIQRSQICIKIPTTWEGIQACKHLQSNGIQTLATTLFSMPQAILAAEANCHYIAPYVNELRVHFDATFKDEAKLFELCVEAQMYYEKHGYRTKVLPASLVSIEECLMLSGVHHITIAPPLLLSLSQGPNLGVKSIFDSPQINGAVSVSEKHTFMSDESAYRIAFTRSGNGSAERKLSEAINIFSDMQLKLEEIMRNNS